MCLRHLRLVILWTSISPCMRPASVIGEIWNMHVGLSEHSSSGEVRIVEIKLVQRILISQLLLLSGKLVRVLLQSSL